MSDTTDAPGARSTPVHEEARTRTGWTGRTSTRDIAAIRKDDTDGGLAQADVHPDPILQFTHWFHEAEAASVPERTAMPVATVSPDGQPSASGDFPPS